MVLVYCTGLFFLISDVFIMRIFKIYRIFIYFGFIIIVATCSPHDQIKYADPRIGNVGLILEPTRPTVQRPNQLIRVYPNRKDYLDDQITSFPLTLISHRLGQLFQIMPFTGRPAENIHPVSAWDQGNEICTPYYYSVFLQDYNTVLEFSPGEKSGCFRISYPGDSAKHLMLNIVNEGKWEMLTTRSIAGEENFHGMKAYVYCEFNHSAGFTFIQSGNPLQQGGIISWPGDSAITIEFKYAISFISEAQARKNLRNETENLDFGKIKENAKKAWGKVLDQIDVEGGTLANRRTFYTALYRCFERMVNITEEGRYYSNYDGKVHETDREFYVDDWIWDTYLALHPLRCILDPVMESEMISSYISMYEQSGWLPTFPVLWGDNPCMNGFHSTIMILDAYRKGIRNFDINKGYEGMKKNALAATMLPWRNGPGCELDSFYYAHGFFPALRPGEKETEPLVHPFEKRQAVAITLGHSYDDWALARMAERLGHEDDMKLFSARSGNYKNLYNKEKGFFMPKDAHAEWIDIDPLFDGGMGGRDYYDENNGYTYLWQVQHDIPGLIALMGGEKAFVSRLDQLFRSDLGRSKYELWAKFPDFTGITGQYSMGNEPSFHIPYLYNFTSSPWKTQRRVRMLLSNWFPDNIFGIPGDEDGGGMSAFVVFSSMGFYPVVPGLPIYTIGSPVFSKIEINLPNGKKFRVIASKNSEKNIYVQQAFLNGKALEGPWFTHTDLMKGGELKLIMGPLPNKNWGTQPGFFREISQE
jgi:predicted alpha-1,2-mannosidase